jgi:GH43 family beta-xylosidase
LNPSSWVKNAAPVFAKTDKVFGPGHASFVKSPDGTEDWIVYHAAKYRGSGPDRNIRIQRFDWNADGSPNFGQPVDPEIFLKVPSGE